MVGKRTSGQTIDRAGLALFFLRHKVAYPSGVIGHLSAPLYRIGAMTQALRVYLCHAETSIPRGCTPDDINFLGGLVSVMLRHAFWAEASRVAWERDPSLQGTDLHTVVISRCETWSLTRSG